MSSFLCCREATFLSEFRLLQSDLCVGFLHPQAKWNTYTEIQQEPPLHLLLLRGVLSSTAFSVLDQNPHSFVLNLPVNLI